MKKSKLFEKFEEEKILNETSSQIFGGTPQYSELTGDHECTNAGGTPDCADYAGGKTDLFEDGIFTQADNDTQEFIQG